MSKAAFAAAAFLLLALAVSAERAWVANRTGTTVDLFDAASGAHEGRVTVGSSPVDLAPDAHETQGPLRIFVANSGSNSVSVVGVNPLGVAATVTGGGNFGTFMTPSGVVRLPSGAIGVVDQKVTTYTGTPTGRSTIRFLSPTSYTVLDDYRDASPSARYQDIVVTSNGRLWIADDGDQGVTVVRFSPAGPPYGFPKTLLYQGTGEFADFIKDPAVSKSYLVAPRRLATDGDARVVVADGGSTKVVVLDANYPGGAANGNDSVAVLQVLDLGATPQDVEVVGSFAYVTTSGVNNLHRIDLNTYDVVPASLPGTVAGLGATSDKTTLFVGAGSGSGLIQSLDLTAPWPPAPVAIPAFPTSGDFPFAFYASPRSASDTPGPPATVNPDPPFISQSNTTSTSNGANCGLLGLEVLLLLGVNVLIRSKR
jgi:YVTN family beta-propeller protein